VHGENAEAVARGFSPFIEMVDPATAVFTLTARQLAQAVLENRGLQMAVADTAEAAILAARHLPGFTLVEEGTLDLLPLDVLPPDPELFQTLELWGIRTLGELARLPQAGIAERLGERGLALQRRARGALDRPLRPELESQRYLESAEMEHPIELREPLLFLIGRFLFDLSSRMKSQSVAAQTLRLVLNERERMLGLPFPTRDTKLLLKLTEHSLDRQPPEGPIERVTVELIPTAPRRVQHGLFVPAAPEPEKLELTLGKIRAFLGPGKAGYPELFDTHRPQAGRVKESALWPKLAFRYFRPPLEARVELENHFPRAVTTRLVRGRVLQLAGPWRSSGDWWSSGWDRDEWDLLLNDGAIYRLCRDRASRNWSLEGVYD
jgi:protein ImuB